MVLLAKLDLSPGHRALVIEEAIAFRKEKMKAPDELFSRAELKEMLPLFWGWFDCILLNPAGEIVVVDLEEMELPNFDSGKKEQYFHAGIVKGAEKYPFLSNYLPSRPSDGKDCPWCQIAAFPGPKTSCICGGLGWLTAESYQHYIDSGMFGDERDA